MNTIEKIRMTFNIFKLFNKKNNIKNIVSLNDETYLYFNNLLTKRVYNLPPPPIRIIRG